MNEQPTNNPVDLAESAVAFLKEHGVKQEQRKELGAMMAVAVAMAPLTSEQRARVMRWIDSVYLSHHEIEEGEDIAPLVDQEMSFPIARQVMHHHLKDEDLRLGYRANIAMLMHDRLHDLGYKPKLKPEDRDSIAEQLIHLIFST